MAKTSPTRFLSSGNVYDFSADDEVVRPRSRNFLAHSVSVG